MTSTIMYKFKIVFMVKSFFVAGIVGFLVLENRLLISRYMQISNTSFIPWRTFKVNIPGSLSECVFLTFKIISYENRKNQSN